MAATSCNDPAHADLLARLERLASDFAALTRRCYAQDVAIADLRAKLGRDSSNSSKPQSSDPPFAKVKRPRTPSGKNQGGQPGHPGSTRHLLAAEDVDHFVPHWPETCTCGVSVRRRGRTRSEDIAMRQVSEPGLICSGRTAELGVSRHDATEAAIVRRVFDETRSGAGLCEVAEGLNRDRVPTHKGGREWFPSAIRRVLTNPVYTGALVYGRTTRSPKGGQPVRVEGAHEAIIPLHVFEAVQTFRAARQRAGCPPSRWDQGFVLTGLVKCPDCGGRMYGGSSGTARGPNVRYYGHARSRVPGAPKCHKVRADVVERAVLDEVARALSGPSVLEAVRRELVNELLREGTDDARHRAELEEALAKEEQRAKVLYQDRVDGVLTPTQFAEWNAASVERQAEIRRDIRAIEDRLLSLGRHVDVEALLTNLRDVPRALATLTPRETKTLLWEVVREVSLTGAKGTTSGVTIVFRLSGIGNGQWNARLNAI